jgi:hypothetical protein
LRRTDDAITDFGRLAAPQHFDGMLFVEHNMLAFEGNRKNEEEKRIWIGEGFDRRPCLLLGHVGVQRRDGP